MGFLKSLKGKLHGDEQRDDLSSSNHQSPEINYDGETTKREKQRVFGTLWTNDNPQKNETYTAPSGPPPSHQEAFEPPAGPPPGRQGDPPPYQDWLQVPDNSQLPPPPALHSKWSPTNNASEDSAERGHAFCDENPVYMPAMPSEAIYTAGNSQSLEIPHHFKASTIKSPARADDSCFMTNLPLYFAAKDNPIVRDSPTPRTISLGIKIIQLDDPNAVVGVGFAGKPYPPFRQPGWHRCSLAVHADDGRRYINDPDGGLEFVQPFRTGDIIKMKITFYPQFSPVVEDTSAEMNGATIPRCRTRVEFERNGHPEGGWDMHEERDAEHAGIDGLQGEDDLYAAVGACGNCQFQVLLWPQTEDHI